MSQFYGDITCILHTCHPPVKGQLQYHDDDKDDDDNDDVVLVVVKSDDIVVGMYRFQSNFSNSSKFVSITIHSSKIQPHTWIKTIQKLIG